MQLKSLGTANISHVLGSDGSFSAGGNIEGERFRFDITDPYLDYLMDADSTVGSQEWMDLGLTEKVERYKIKPSVGINKEPEDGPGGRFIHRTSMPTHPVPQLLDPDFRGGYLNRLGLPTSNRSAGNALRKFTKWQNWRAGTKMDEFQNRFRKFQEGGGDKRAFLEEEFPNNCLLCTSQRPRD